MALSMTAQNNNFLESLQVNGQEFCFVSELPFPQCAKRCIKSGLALAVVGNVVYIRDSIDQAVDQAVESVYTVESAVDSYLLTMVNRILVGKTTIDCELVCELKIVVNETGFNMLVNTGSIIIHDNNKKLAIIELDGNLHSSKNFGE